MRVRPRGGNDDDASDIGVTITDTEYFITIGQAVQLRELLGQKIDEAMLIKSQQEEIDTQFDENLECPSCSGSGKYNDNLSFDNENICGDCQVSGEIPVD